MKKDTAKNNPAVRPPLTSLKDILGIVDTPVLATFLLDDRECQIKVRRAMPSVMEKRRALLRSVQPPFVKERNEYDTLNPQYLQRRDESILQARSLTVYLCCEEVAALKPGLTEPSQIHAAISGLLPETILELIELTAIAGGLDAEVTKRANFMSAAPSES